MQKSIIKKQAEEKLQQLKDLLSKTDISAPATHAEVKEIQHRLQEAGRIITVYEYMLAQNELSSDINVHLKIMEMTKGKDQVSADLHLKEQAENKDVIPKEKPLVKREEEKPKEEVKKAEEIKNEKPVNNSKKVPANLQLSINDKYRIINELFHQNHQEFNIAVEQLNSVESWYDAKVYLNSLANLYGWDPEKDIVKTLDRITQKRFS
jgi:hypothetical protein